MSPDCRVSPDKIVLQAHKHSILLVKKSIACKKCLHLQLVIWWRRLDPKHGNGNRHCRKQEFAAGAHTGCTGHVVQVTKKSHRFLCGCSGQEKLVRQSDVRALSEKQQEQAVPAELKLKRRKRPGTPSLNGLVDVPSVF